MPSRNIRKLLVLTGFTAALSVATLTGAALVGAGIAAAAGEVTVSAPSTVDTDGTQGSYAPAVQGAQDDDGDQDAHLTNSWVVAPQDKPHG